MFTSKVLLRDKALIQFNLEQEVRVLVFPFPYLCLCFVLCVVGSLFRIV